MDLYRFTGALTGLVISGGISLFFFIVSRGAPAPDYNGWIIYSLILPMVLFGFIFDTHAIWRQMSRVSKLLSPSFFGSAIFWTFTWPFCKLLSDLISAWFIALQTGGQIVWPAYLFSLGINGIPGFILFQAIVGSGMGMMFFMAYRPMFEVVGKLRVRVGMADADYELTVDEEFHEFGFRAFGSGRK